jgi:hypothetical protein
MYEYSLLCDEATVIGQEIDPSPQLRNTFSIKD